MEVVIIEDEDLAAEYLASILLKTRFNLKVIKRLHSVKQATAWFKDNTCDLIFSDIHLGDGESFEIFDALNIHIPIIFTTAFDQYAIQSFQFHAVDYLLKPYDKEKLHQAIEKYVSYTSTPEIKYKELQKLLQKLKTESNHQAEQTRFLVSKGKELVSISSEEVAYFMADDKLLFLFTQTGKVYLYEDTISNLELKLSKRDFFKINRKFIVKHQAIKSIVKYSQNRLRVDLHPSPNNKEPILISAKTIRTFKDWLNN